MASNWNAATPNEDELIRIRDEAKNLYGQQLALREEAKRQYNLIADKTTDEADKARQEVEKHEAYVVGVKDRLDKAESALYNYRSTKYGKTQQPTEEGMSDTKPKRSKKMIFFKSIILLFAGIGLAITILGVVLSRDEISQRWDNFWADIPTWEDVFNQEASGSPAPTPSTSPATPAPTAAPTPVVTPAPAPTPEITPAPSVKPGYIPPPTDAQRCSSTKFDLAGHTSLAEISLGGPNHLQFYWFTGDPEKTTLVPAGMEHQIFAKTLLGANWAYTPACTEEYVRAQITASTPLRKADTVIADPYFMEWQISGLYN